MYAINEEMKMINGEVVETFEREITEGKTILRVEAGTTGYKGGGRNAGSRSYLCIDCMCGDFCFSEVDDEDGTAVGVLVACCGDDGLNALMKALEFAAQAMNDQRCEVDD